MTTNPPSTTAPGAAIRATGLTKAYGDPPVLSGVDLAVLDPTNPSLG